MIEALAAEPGTSDLAQFLRETPVNQTEPGLTPCFGTVLQSTPSGRARIIRHVDQAPHPDAPDPAAQLAMLERWQREVEAATSAAVGVKVRHGEALCLDNYRVMHARRPYEDTDRELFVSWAWTADALSLPSGERLAFAAT